MTSSLARTALSDNALTLLQTRYLSNGESVDGMFRRVAGGNDDYFNLMASLRFLPNSPALFNAGLNNGCTSSACFVFDVADSMLDGPRSICATRDKAVAVAKAGGGVGYYFGDLRRKGALIKSVHRKACGPVAVIRDYHGIHKLITQGGKRDLAQMAILPVWHDDIRDFIHCKDDDPQALSSFNLSVSWPDACLEESSRPGSKLNGLWDEQVDSAWKHGCPGMFFRDAVNRHNPNPDIGDINAPNPCLTGATLVATADGRGHVSIHQLAEEGHDVPVYCLNDEDELTVRTLRNPRLTGVNRKIYKVVLDDGLEIRVTGTHKFRLRNGLYVDASALQPGDSLALLTRYVPDNVAAGSDSYADRYIGLQAGCGYYIEHRLIAEWHAGRTILAGEHVHHRDGNRLNNTPCNLEVKPETEHLSDHSRGEGNPKFGGISNDELVVWGRKLTRSLGHRFTRREWVDFALENGLPTHFSEWREKSLGSLVVFAKRCAVLEDVAEYPDVDPRTIRVYQRLLASGLDAGIVMGKVLVHKRCEQCGETFTIPANRREVSFCSISCANRRRDSSRAAASNRAVSARKQEKVRERQLEVYAALKNELGRLPQRKEWAAACKRAGVSAEISRKSSPFKSWSELTEAGAAFNHRVVAVTEDGYEDVYNGTVDDFHNFFVGGWNQGTTDAGRSRHCYINNQQCGETPNRCDEPCSLASLSLPRYFRRATRDIDWTALGDDVRLGNRFMEDLLNRNEFPHPDITRAAFLTRKLGMGVMGWADLLALLHIHYDTQEAVDLGKRLMAFINKRSLESSLELAKEHGPYPGYSDRTNGPPSRHETFTGIAPTGSIAIIANVFGAIEPHFALEWDRKTNEGIIFKERISCWDDLEGFVPRVASEISWQWHVRHQAAFQAHTGLGVSKTINLPNSATRQDVSDAYRMMWESGCKGGTVFRDGCRNEQVLRATTPANGRKSFVGSNGANGTAVNGTVTDTTISVTDGGKRQKLPRVRDGKIVRFSLGGFKGYLTAGLRADGQPGEIFLQAAREGTTVSGMLDAWAKSISLILQYGAPVSELVRMFAGMRFEPAGLTDDPDVKAATSIPDFVVRWLAHHYGGLPDSGLPHTGMICPDCSSLAIYQGGCLTCSKACGWSRCG